MCEVCSRPPCRAAVTWDSHFCDLLALGLWYQTFEQFVHVSFRLFDIQTPQNMPLVLRCLTSTLVRRLGAGPAAAVPRRAFRGEGLIEPRPICSIVSAMRCPARAQARSQHVRGMAMSDVTPQKGTVMVTIIDPVTAKDGRQIQARIGASVLDVAQEHDMVCSAVVPGARTLPLPCAPGTPVHYRIGRGIFISLAPALCRTLRRPSGSALSRSPLRARCRHAGLTRCGTQELEGACEGTLACSTCHCIFTKELYAKLPPPDEEELDMLDLAAGLTDT